MNQKRKTMSHSRNRPDLNGSFNKRRAIAIVALIVIVGYGFWNARNIIMGPRVVIYSPQQTSQTSENVTLIQGIAKNVTFLSLNNRPIFIDPEGNFKEKLLLSPGFNTIRLYGRDRFKQEVTKEIKVYYNN